MKKRKVKSNKKHIDKSSNKELKAALKKIDKNIHKKIKSTKKSLHQKTNIYNTVAGNKHIIMFFILFFSSVLLVSSFFKFEASKKISPEVRGLKAELGYNYIPADGVLNNTEQKSNNTKITYSTRLSKDQIDNFYDSLALMNNWEKEEYAKYKCGSGSFVYSLVQEEGGKNVVSYSYCNSK